MLIKWEQTFAADIVAPNVTTVCVALQSGISSCVSCSQRVFPHAAGAGWRKIREVPVTNPGELQQCDKRFRKQISPDQLECQKIRVQTRRMRVGLEAKVAENGSQSERHSKETLARNPHALKTGNYERVFERLNGLPSAAKRKACVYRASGCQIAVFYLTNYKPQRTIAKNYEY